MAVKPLEWIASSRKELKSFPDPVRRKMGYALYRAQQGGTAEATKPLKGLGSGVVEVIADHDGNAYRAVYTIRFTWAVYVLHVFQKKSKTGIATPRPEIDLIRKRLKAAADHYRTSHGKEPNDG